MTITAKTRIALNKESSYGVPGSTWNLFPVNPPSLTQTYENIVDSGLRGMPVKDYGVYRGAGHVEASLEGIFYPEEVGYLLFGMLGSVTTTGSGTFTHTFKVGESPPSFAIEDYPKLQAPGSAEAALSYQYLGCLLSELVIRFAAGEGACGFTATAIGKASGTASPATVVGTPNPAFLGWQGSVDVGDYGGAYSPFGQVVSAEWTFSRETVLQHALNNTTEPTFGYSGPLEVVCAAVIKFHADSDISRYRDDTHMKVKMTLTNGAKSLKIECPDMFFDSAPTMDRSDVDVKANWTLRALYDTATLTPVTVTLVNLKGSYSA